MTRHTRNSRIHHGRSEGLRRLIRLSLASLPAIPDEILSWLAGELGPDERRAMREIAERADLLQVDGQTYLIAPVTPRCIDALAAFEAAGEDRESDPLEPSIGGDDREEETRL